MSAANAIVSQGILRLFRFLRCDDFAPPRRGCLRCFGFDAAVCADELAPLRAVELEERFGFALELRRFRVGELVAALLEPPFEPPFGVDDGVACGWRGRSELTSLIVASR